MSEYPKIKSLFVRDEKTHKLIIGDFLSPSFTQVARWHVSEKIDGTNIRLILKDGSVAVRGRSDKTQLPPNFLEEALPHITGELMVEALNCIDSTSTGMVVYGEGYGHGIQAEGELYAPHKSFRIFDVLTLPEERWCSWKSVEKVSSALGLHTVPVISWNMSLTDVVHFVASRPASIVAGIEAEEERDMEGVVARTDPYLYDSDGLVKFKLKGKDLP
jgi:ATP-dependent RNA circularization protein (DNA/RNA ligase family)